MTVLIAVLTIIFWIATFCIVWAMGGYKLSLKLITYIVKPGKLIATADKPTVTVMIVAHNEEIVIESKLNNVVDNDYPTDRISYLVASDNSSDRTNEIVQEFMAAHDNLKISLYVTKEHKGKTNAQNEAQKTVNSEILVMTDANAMFKKNTISELVSSFSEPKIVYVCGALLYINSDTSTAISESNYWNGELVTREMESNIRTITAGNGAVYACRNSEYMDVPLIECHDFSMPFYYGRAGKRAVFNKNAIAFEKTGESAEDEYRRKVRMNRGILSCIKKGTEVINPFKYGWFSYFYFGHRTARYMLWINHLVVLGTSILLTILDGNLFWKITLACQMMFYLLGLIGKFTTNRVIHMVYYYCMTVVAQWNGVFNIITGRAKPTWESVKSTR